MFRCVYGIEGIDCDFRNYIKVGMEIDINELRGRIEVNLVLMFWIFFFR